MPRPTDSDNDRPDYSPRISTPAELIARFGREIMVLTGSDIRTRKIVKRVIFEVKLSQCLKAAEQETCLADRNSRTLYEMDQYHRFDQIAGTRAHDGDIS